MSQQQRTEQRTEQRTDPGYRGALSPRQDVLARPWVVIVIAAFVLMFVLSFLGFPSNLLTAQPSPSPVPSLSTSPSVSPAASASAGAS
jgi:ABC-type Fe3+ transport system permease subunit